MALTEYEIIFRKRFEKIFAKIDKAAQQTIVDEFERLAKNPFKHSQVKKISNTKNGYRLRVGRFRILFAVEQKIIDVIDIFMEKDRADYQIRLKLFTK